MFLDIYSKLFLDFALAVFKDIQAFQFYHKHAKAHLANL
jgi:hypothetical protein